MTMNYFQQHYQIHDLHHLPPPACSYHSFNSEVSTAHAMAQYHRPDAERWQGPYARSAVLQHSITKTETKPRLAKEEVEQLEAEFQKNHKPNASLKKGLAEQMRVDIARINNWFQNRRAKAKQEKKAREFESSRRKVDNIKAEPSSPEVKEFFPSSEQHDDLRPSTAVFPAANAQMANSTDEDSGDEITPTIESADENLQSAPDASLHSEYASPASLSPPDDSQGFEFALPAEGYYQSQPSEYPEGLTAMDMLRNQPFSDQVQISTSEPMCTLQEAAVGLQAFATYPMMVMPQAVNSMAAFSNTALSEASDVVPDLEAHVVQQSIETVFQHFSPESMASPLMSSPPGLRIKSPPAVDIASRRKRPQPATLRTASYHQGPKTGFEFDRRADSGSPIRRVSSATGQGRIQKPLTAAPRSPFFERRHEALIQLMRSPPTMNAPFTMAPPTPNTPVVSNPQSLREATVSSTSSEEEKAFLYQQAMASRIPLLDPTLRTPPATPSMVNFSEVYQATLGFAVHDEPIHTPSFATFAETDYAIPAYIADHGMSQPTTPGFMPSAMGPSYFASYSGSNPEYNWTDSTPAVPKTSPKPAPPRVRELQFTNFTAQDFNGEK